MKTTYTRSAPKTILISALTILWISFIGVSCSEGIEKQEYDSWKKERYNELKDPYGWPSVVGLYWIRNSIAYFGDGPTNDIILPSTAPSGFGYITKTDTAFYMNAHYSLRVQVDGQHATKVRMLSDKEPNGPTIASWRSLQWYIIERQDKAYLRVKDTLSTYRQALADIPYFDYDPSYRVTAEFIPADSTDRVQYENILGMEFNVPFAGYLSFTLKGKEYRLRALENDDISYFVIVGDLTNGESTYGGGRYLYPPVANEDGTVILDFNRLINPPCVFTPYATCPLPPEENKMDIAIVVGEKMLSLY